MSNAERVEQIRERLEQAFAPESLQIDDDSHMHVGHPGAKDGRGHFSVRIVATRFSGHSPIERHRMVYEALGNMMLTDIHALRITALERE